MNDGMIGEVRIFSGNYAPRGWLPCEGQFLEIRNNQTLFSILGTMYGGDGRMNFGIPDLRGRVAVHAANGEAGSEMPSIPLGQKLGMEEMTLTERNLPAHTHQVSIKLKATDQDANHDNPDGRVIAKDRGQPTYNQSPANVDMAPGSLDITVGYTGQGEPFSLLAPSLGIGYYICFEGAYPARG
ncbi:MAG: tail fiber protein [Bacteroidota bacterium]